MGAGRKTQTYKLNEKAQPHWSVNGRVTARNLRKSDLGGVIFGCKYNTIKECYSKQLFGLPAPHLSYVKNIDPGLTLFLFNYSDRKLHGVFEAASHGQLNIDPYAWTAGGSDYTPYAAQVRIRVQMRCQPLQEDQFRPVIKGNYYEPRLFWFELDQAQTNKLISLFSSSAVTTSISLSRNVEKLSSLFKSSSNPNARQEGESVEASSLEVVADPDWGNVGWGSSWNYPNARQEGDSIEASATEVVADPDWGNVGWGSSWNYPAGGGGSQRLETLSNNEDTRQAEQETLHMKTSFGQSNLLVVKGMNASPPRKKWSALFKEETTSDASKEVEDMKTSALEVNPLHADKFDVEWDSCFAPCLDGPSWPLEEPASKEDLENYAELSYSNEGNLEWSSSCIETCLDKDNHPGEAPTYENVCEEENVHKSHCESSYVSAVTRDIIDDHGETEEHLADVCFPEAAQVLETKSSSLHSLLAKLLLEVEELKLSQFKQVQKVNSLEQELVESREEIRQLKDRCISLEVGSFPETRHVEAEESEAEEYQSDNELNPNLDESILMVGGFNGSSWLSTLDSYSPSQDLMTSISSMTFMRSYTSAVNLNGELYIFGGAYGTIWYDTVESYDLMTNQWDRRPSLNQKKGSLAGVSLNEKIFAIGGGNGVQCFSEVEMFDLDFGKWIPTRSMLHKRFAPAATEINGVIYVVGGYDGDDYLNSVERFDPREHSWTRLESMSTKRGCHSVAVLNEKLYALGGFDGSRMVPIVEIFDPRIGRWSVGESMNDSRGYSVAVAIGDAIYIIGGLKDDEEILDTVECYREGDGWQVTDLKAMGKRCIFSAAVM